MATTSIANLRLEDFDDERMKKLLTYASRNGSEFKIFETLLNRPIGADEAFKYIDGSNTSRPNFFKRDGKNVWIIRLTSEHKPAVEFYGPTPEAAMDHMELDENVPISEPRPKPKRL